MDEDDTIQEFIEKPARPASNWAFSGAMIGGQEIFDFLPDRRPADIGFDVLPKMAGKMAGYRISEYLIDIGTPENYQAAQQSWPGLARSQELAESK